MPWKETQVVEERLKFVTAAIEGEWPIADLCRAFGISRKTGYKYIERYEKFGIDGLQDRSRAPILQAQKTPTEMVDMILDFRRLHPKWGPRKILKVLERTHPSII
jgi:transposase